ncbi:hypothetical protein ABMA28_011601 [Loxostege sticticalis]|uniref:26S proteasome complex subunit SEM1 n=1 Tax=Loxostege sticticalis TaxID=481309 RepID=A0ABD0S6A5_LOXSC
MADKQKVDLGLLEEDDEFEEFPAENWGTEDADDEDVSVWEDNWEDDIVQDDFNQQLRPTFLCLAAFISGVSPALSLESGLAPKVSSSSKYSGSETRLISEPKK